jgi:ankyrin repeat protein
MMFRFFLLVAGFAWANGVVAQTAPSASEIASYTGLHLAAHEGDVAVINRLLAAGSDPDVRDSLLRTPAHVAAFASHDDVMIALAAGGADMNALESRLYDVLTIASVADDPELVKLAIKLGNKSTLTTSIYDGTALIAAAHLGHHEVVKYLIDGGAPLDHVNNLAWTALIEAVVLGDGGINHIKTVQLLVDAGADKSIGDGSGVTPLQHATSRGYAEMVEILK